jgi:hypothetical protein
MSENKVVNPGNEGKSNPAQNPIMAIDILLEPNATMIQHAQAANAGLLRNFPKGYSLDDEHKPHISVMEATYIQPIWTRYSSLLMRFWPPRRC